jgi:hypothetical protein
MDIIKKSRKYFGLREFDLEAHNKVKDVLDKKNASEKADRKVKTYTQGLMDFKEALMDVEKNEAPLKKFIKDTRVNNGLLVEECQERIERNLAMIALDKSKQMKLGTKVAEDISYIIAHVAIDHKLRKEDRTTEDYEAELESQAIKVRKSKAFDKIAKECLNDWNKLVEHGVDALKTNGKGIALTFAKEDKYINDRRKQNHKKSDERSTSEKNETNLNTKANTNAVKNSFKKK